MSLMARVAVLCCNNPPRVHTLPALFHPTTLQFASHPEPIVADSCIVALDMLDFEQSGGFSYADTGAAAGEEAAVQPAAA